MKKLNFAFLDITHPHIWTRAAILRDREDINLVSVWEPNDKGGGKAFSEMIGVKIANTKEEILNNPIIDAVIISSFTQFMADLTEDAIKAGKAVLLEKPASNNLENMQRVVEASKNSLVQIGYMMRMCPMIDFAKEIIENGILGRITVAEFHVATPTPDPTTVWFNLENDIGGILFEDGCHMLDLAINLFGKPKRVTGFVPKFDDLTKKYKHMYEDAAVVNLGWDNMVGSMTLVGWEATEWMESWKIIIYGDKGTLEIGLLPDYYKLYLKESNGKYLKGWNKYFETQFPVPWLDHSATHVWHAVPHKAYFRRELELFTNAIREKKTRAGVTPEDALKIVEVVKAIYESDNIKAFVNL